ncbi:MAG TPA: hypothetical protein VFF89_01310, partial [Sphingobium sp.]|nr:hypothetical protein [Sphingobium sp.]
MKRMRMSALEAVTPVDSVRPTNRKRRIAEGRRQSAAEETRMAEARTLPVRNPRTGVVDFMLPVTPGAE